MLAEFFLFLIIRARYGVWLGLWLWLIILWAWLRLWFRLGLIMLWFIIVSSVWLGVLGVILGSRFRLYLFFFFIIVIDFRSRLWHAIILFCFPVTLLVSWFSLLIFFFILLPPKSSLQPKVFSELFIEHRVSLTSLESIRHRNDMLISQHHLLEKDENRYDQKICFLHF